MKWRQFGHSNGIISKRRILSKIGPRNELPATPSAFRPIPPLFDDFTRLAQHNLFRLIAASERSYPDDGTDDFPPKSDNDRFSSFPVHDDGVCHGSGQIKTLEGKEGTIPSSSKGPFQDARPTRSHEHRGPSIRFHISKPSEGNCFPSVNKAVNEPRKITEEHDSLHEELDQVLNAFRTLHDQPSPSKTSSTSSRLKPKAGALHQFTPALQPSKQNPSNGRHYYSQETNKDDSMLEESAEDRDSVYNAPKGGLSFPT